VAQLGHWAFFRERFREPLWTAAARFLCDAVAD
jgi:predicted alpha/beta hydrolase